MAKGMIKNNKNIYRFCVDENGHVNYSCDCVKRKNCLSHPKIPKYDMFLTPN